MVNVPEGVEVGEQLVISVPDDGVRQAELETRAFVGKLIALHEMAEARCATSAAGASHSRDASAPASAGRRRSGARQRLRDWRRRQGLTVES